MKFTPTLLSATIAGVLTLGAIDAAAFPLYLTSLNGRITCTANYGPYSTNLDNVDLTSNKVTRASVNLKKMMIVVSNQVYRTTAGGTVVPTDAKIVYDPYVNQTYLTNSSGFSYSLSGIARVEIDEIATSFRGNNSGGSENDTILVWIDIYGYGPDDLYYEFEVYGQGKLVFTLNGKTQMGKMRISLSNGSDYGEYQSSDSGVTRGGFKMKGAGEPEWAGPYSIYWWD